VATLSPVTRFVSRTSFKPPTVETSSCMKPFLSLVIPFEGFSTAQAVFAHRLSATIRVGVSVSVTIRVSFGSTTRAPARSHGLSLAHSL